MQKRTLRFIVVDFTSGGARGVDVMADYYAQDVVLLAFKFIFLNIICLNCCPLWGYWLNICLDSCLSSFLFLTFFFSRIG